MFLGDRIHKFHRCVIGEMHRPLSQWSSCRQQMVVTLVMHSAKAHIRVEITDTEGGIRATSVLCLLGLGLGLGSLLLYRFCTRIFSAQSRTAPPRAERKRSKPRDDVKTSFSARPEKAASNTECDSPQPSPEGTIDSGISTSLSTNTMGNLSSSPDCPSQSVFYNPTVEGVRFRGPAGPDGTAGGSLETDGDGFVHVCHDAAPPQHGDAESGISLLGSSPESQEINYFSQGSNRQRRVPPLHIDIPHGHNSEMDAFAAASASSHATEPDEVDAGLGFTPPSSLNTSFGAQSMKANFSPVSLKERNLRIEAGDSVSELDKSSCSKVPSVGRDRNHSTPISDCNKSLSNSTSFPEELTSVEHKHADEVKGIPSSHSNFSVGLADFDESSIAECRSESFDFSEGMSDITSPDRDLFSPVDFDSQTEESMENLETNLKEVQEEISEISQKIQMMCQNISIPSAVALGPDHPKCASPEVQKAFNVLHRHALRRSSNTASPVQDGDTSESFTKDHGESSKGSRTFTHSGEYVWDCGPDLCAAQNELPDRRKILGRWATLENSDNSSPSPTVASSSGSGSSPLHAAAKANVSRPSHSASLSSFADLTPDSSRHGSVSVNDLYIDDGFSDLASQRDSSSRVSLNSTSKSGSFPSSIASSAHTSPLHTSRYDGATSSELNADAQTSDGADSSNNNTAEHAITSAEDLPQDCDSSQTSDLPAETSASTSLDANRNPTFDPNQGASGAGILNIGPKVQLVAYAEKEWKGTTKRAKTMKQGYDSIPDLLHKQHIRRIRGDNYCAIRAVLYQCLVNDVDINNNISKRINVSEDLNIFNSESHSYLDKWSFGGRMETSPGRKYPVMKQLVDCLFRQVNGVRQLRGTSCKEELICALLNNKQSVDLQLVEAVKALMMATAVKLFEDYQCEKPVPVFVWLMFARDTSLDPRSFFENHLNPVGDSGGLEQVEMFLLAHTLGINIEVVRPSQFGSDDFLTEFVDDDSEKASFPKVLLIAEDDRHYNVLV